MSSLQRLECVAKWHVDGVSILRRSSPIKINACSGFDRRINPHQKTYTPPRLTSADVGHRSAITKTREGFCEYPLRLLPKVERNLKMEMQTKNSTLLPGLRLEKVGPQGRVWVVTRLVDGLGLPHAVIASEANLDDTRLMAQSVLMDKSCYRKLARTRTE